jgi:hypothetical protein
MKKHHYFGFLALLFATTFNTLQAKIWRVNNGTGVVADFTTVQAAHNAAAAGDTIHLEPSLNDYGNLTMTKRLTIISTGSFSTSNPNLQSDPKHALVGNVNISNTGANGSVLSVRFNNGFNISSGVSNISLVNCVADGADDNANCCGRPYVDINNADNIIVSKSFVGSLRFTNNSNNIVVNNSIVWGLIDNDGTSDGVITNNVFRAGYANDAASISNCVVANNIWNKNLATSFTNCNVGNNFAPGTGTAPSGFTFVDMSTVFVDANGGFVDNVYQLKAGSPAIAAGEGGIDCGAFGGGSPFKLGVTPAIPSIYKLNVPAAPAGNSMNIIFSTRSNN